MGIGINGLGNLQENMIKQFSDRSREAKNGKKGFGDYKDTFEHGYDTSSAEAYNKKLNMIHNVEKTENSGPELSDRAKKLLEELKEKFGNTDFFVADYSSDEEASRILSATEKEYGVLMTADELEKMAADEEYKEKIFGIIEQGQSTIEEFRSGLSEEEAESVKSIGFTVSDDGTLKFFAELQKQSEKNTERIEKIREERRSSEKDIKDRQEKRMDEKEGRFPMVRRFVKADSIGELADALRDFLEAKEEETAESINIQA